MKLHRHTFGPYGGYFYCDICKEIPTRLMGATMDDTNVKGEPIPPLTANQRALAAAAKEFVDRENSKFELQREPLAHQGGPTPEEQPRRVGKDPRLAMGYGANAGISCEEAQPRSVVPKGPKCIVAGCSNRWGHGVFHGELCSACHRMLTTGSPGTGSTFIHQLEKEANENKRQLRKTRARRILDEACRREHHAFSSSQEVNLALFGIELALGADHETGDYEKG